jgi:hypothetical protein
MPHQPLPRAASITGEAALFLFNPKAFPIDTDKDFRHDRHASLPQFSGPGGSLQREPPILFQNQRKVIFGVAAHMNADYIIRETKKEAFRLEKQLLETTRSLLSLEKKYRSKKIELLAQIETYEAKLNWLKAKQKPVIS